MNLPSLLTSSLIVSVFCSSAVLADVPTKDELNLILKKLSHEAILPLYQSADEKASALHRQILAFCNQPTIENLQASRQHWSQALTAWETSEVSLFGPAIRRQRDLHIYFHPVKKRVIKTLLSQESPINAKDLKRAGAGAKGFATVEYFLFERETSDTDLLKKFTGSDNRNCQHLLATSILLQSDIAAIYNEWSKAYHDAVALAGQGEKPVFATPQQALEVILGKLNQLNDKVASKLHHSLAKNAHLGGNDANREAMNAYKLEAWRSGHTLANIQGNLQGLEHVLRKGGLLEWLKQSGETALVEQLELRLATIHNLKFPSTDLFAQIETKQVKTADALFDEVMALSKLIQQMASKFGVQLGFNDSDGD